MKNKGISGLNLEKKPISKTSSLLNLQMKGKKRISTFQDSFGLLFKTLNIDRKDRQRNRNLQWFINYFSSFNMSNFKSFCRLH